MSDENARFKIEEDKFLIYDGKTGRDVCSYFEEDMRDLLLHLLNSAEQRAELKRFETALEKTSGPLAGE